MMTVISCSGSACQQSFVRCDAQRALEAITSRSIVADSKGAWKGVDLNTQAVGVEKQTRQEEYSRTEMNERKKWKNTTDKSFWKSLQKTETIVEEAVNSRWQG